MTIQKMIPRDIDKLLAQVGLERRSSAARYILPVAGIFVAGAAVGAVLAAFLAPTSGAQLRSEVERKLKGAMPSATPDHQPGAPMRATDA